MAKHRARNAKGHYVKSGGHSKAKPHTRTVTKYKTRRAPDKHHRKRRGRGGGMSLVHLAVAGAGLAYLTGAATPVKAITDNIAKIPGAKTFGNTATAGLVCLAIDRFAKRNRYLRAAGIIGVVLAAVQVGTQGTNFKWLGDGERERGEFTGDIDADDVGDADDE